MNSKLKDIHPLSLPEIVLTIGKSIPLWVPKQVKGETVYLLQPKDLLAALRVNRLFRTTLTLILWTTFAYPADRSHRRFYDQYQGLNRFHKFPADIVEKNSVHFQFLDYSFLGNQTNGTLNVKQLRLDCNNLQELRISTDVGGTLAGQLIKANPGLRVLQLRYDSWMGNACSDLRIIFPLRKLRCLSLRGTWTLNPVYLHHILYNNADTLEELDLRGEGLYLARVPPVNATWNGLRLLDQYRMMTKVQRDEAAGLIQGRSLLLPKVQTLALIIDWAKTSDNTYNLLRAFPSVETLKLALVNEQTAVPLGRSLREFCPNLRSIQNVGLAYNDDMIPPFGPDGMSYIVEAVAHGALVHAALHRQVFDGRLTNALLAHRDGLEVLELSLTWKQSLTVLENIRRVLEECHWLRKFTIYSNSTSYQVQDVSILLDGLKSCQYLETLILVGFPFVHRDLDEVIHGDFGEDVEGVKNMVEQYLKSGRGEAPPSAAVLPHGWRYVHRTIAGINMSASNDKFRKMAFDVIGTLPVMKSVVLNSDLFEKVLL
ncbi:hypothetical protein BGX30_013580 [Mortierella sp. GBA39]|nr:hypothetical protein BGX30_013580 [Mortierella sp. GBA39]